MSKDSIELSPKYGVNPTIPVCFFCGEDKNEIALMGHVRERSENGRAVRGSDIEMPMRTLLDYEPCDKCKDILKNAIAIIEAQTTPTEYPAIQEGLYPTGSRVVIKEEAFDRIFKDEYNFKNSVKKKRVALMEPDVFQQLFGDALKGE